MGRGSKEPEIAKQTLKPFRLKEDRERNREGITDSIVVETTSVSDQEVSELSRTVHSKQLITLFTGLGSQISLIV